MRHRSEQQASGRKNGWFGLGPANLGLIILAVIAILSGYILLNRGSVTAAPVLLVLGYMVLLPTGLLLGFRRLDR